MPSDEPILLDVFADVACPWCYIGHKRLRRALADRDPAAPAVAVRHRAFQLQPDMPVDGEPTAEFFARRFGDAETVRGMHDRVQQAPAEDDIAFDFEHMPKAPNTLLAHRAIALAREQDAEDVALAALYAAYFEQARDITQADVIVATLTEAGVPDPDAIAAGLAADGGEQATAADLALGAELEVRGVPLFVGDGRFGLSGAQPVETLEQFFAHVADARAAA
jgi:predicted DsbA family dithiol-disulfide isomerase